MKTALVRIPALVGACAATFAFAQVASKDARQSTGKGPVYVKIILPMKAPADGKQPEVESWIAKRLKKRGVTEHRAVTDWVRLPDAGEEITHVWNATVDSKGWGCPVAGRVAKRTADGKVKVELSGWAPFAPRIRGQSLPAETGSRRIAVVDTSGTDRSAWAYFALLVGPPSSKPDISDNRQGPPREP